MKVVYQHRFEIEFETGERISRSVSSKYEDITIEAFDAVRDGLMFVSKVIFKDTEAFLHTGKEGKTLSPTNIDEFTDWWMEYIYPHKKYVNTLSKKYAKRLATDYASLVLTHRFIKS